MLEIMRDFVGVVSILGEFGGFCRDGPSSVWVGYGLHVERFVRFRFSVSTVPLCVSVQLSVHL